MTSKQPIRWELMQIVIFKMHYIQSIHLALNFVLFSIHAIGSVFIDYDYTSLIALQQQRPTPSVLFRHLQQFEHLYTKIDMQLLCVLQS